MGWSDAVGLSGYAAAFADAMAHGASYDQAYNAASAATGQSGYSSFNDSGGASYHSVNYNDPYVSAAQSLLSSTVPTTANYNTNTNQQTTKNTSDKVYSSLLPDVKTTAKDLLGQYGNAIVWDYNGNPVAIDFSQPNWQPAWTALWGAGNQIVTDSTNLSDIGKDIRSAGYSNANPIIWTQQAARSGSLTNPQGQTVPVTSTVQQLAQAALERVDADNGQTQAAVNAKAYENTKNYYNQIGKPMPEQYNNLLPGNYSIAPWANSTPAQTGVVSSIDQNLMNAGLSTEIMAQMTPAERFELFQQYQGGGIGGGY